jgi:hypothetical protein
MKGGFVYILASKSGVLYTGVTGTLDKRIIQHRFKVIEGFTKNTTSRGSCTTKGTPTFAPPSRAKSKSKVGRAKRKLP